MRELCAVFGVTRDAYYKAIGREDRSSSREKLIVELVRSIRHYLPRLGGRKLRVKIGTELSAHGFEAPGRDKFFEILKRHGLLLERRKSRNPCTTYSGHNYAVQPNLMRNLLLAKPLQALVSDVTYLRVGSGFAYLFLTTDAFSRKILGFHLAKTLEHAEAIVALDMAMKGIKDPSGIIFHSDRGVQYCCHGFLSVLYSYNMRSSMTDADHCAQNALAERMNGILKNEFYLDEDFLNFAMASKAVRQAIMMYNQERPHGSLEMKTPHYFHSEALAA